MMNALRLVEPLDFDKILAAFERPDHALVIHQRSCPVMHTFICTCHPVFVAPPACV